VTATREKLLDLADCFEAMAVVASACDALPYAREAQVARRAASNIHAAEPPARPAEFRVGDRVRVVATNAVSAPSECVGQIGTVESAANGLSKVRLDTMVHGYASWHFLATDLAHVSSERDEEIERLRAERDAARADAERLTSFRARIASALGVIYGDAGCTGELESVARLIARAEKADQYLRALESIAPDGRSFQLTLPDRNDLPMYGRIALVSPPWIGTVANADGTFDVNHETYDEDTCHGETEQIGFFVTEEWLADRDEERDELRAKLATPPNALRAGIEAAITELAAICAPDWTICALRRHLDSLPATVPAEPVFTAEEARWARAAACGWYADARMASGLDAIADKIARLVKDGAR
jgi:hypothetical protein